MRPRNICAFLALLFAGAAHGAVSYKSLGMSSYAFFKNSTRRDPTAEEKKLVANLSGCTAFFVKNDAGKALLVTARHCVSMSINNWCNGGGTVQDTDGKIGKCTKVIAADVKHDIALFEAKFPYVPDADRGLSLASYSPKVGQRLTMIGYPADQYRKAALTVTEECWITAEDVPSPHGASMGDRSAQHNCTTYGGNSGGPMIAEDEGIAVGLPFTYYPNDYTLYPAEDLKTNARMAKMEDFVGVHRKELDDAKVRIHDPEHEPESLPPPNPDPKTKTDTEPPVK